MKKRVLSLLMAAVLVLSLAPVGAFATEPPAEPEAPEAPVCNCTTKCAEGSVNPDCPVCSAAGADLAVCVGEASQPEPPQVTTIKTWNWIGGDNLNNGVLP